MADGRAWPEVGDTICDAANAVGALQRQIERHPLRELTPKGVREERAVYAVEWSAPPAGGGRLH